MLEVHLAPGMIRERSVVLMKGGCGKCLPYHWQLPVFSEPNDESGANVDASKMWRDDREQFYKIAKQIVQKSLGL